MVATVEPIGRRMAGRCVWARMAVYGSLVAALAGGILSSAVKVTDTARFRCAHHHLPSDTPERLDYDRMARVVDGPAASACPPSP